MNKKHYSLGNQISRTWGHLTSRRRKQLVILGFLMIVASFAEVVSIGTLLPFLSVLMVPEKIFVHEKFQIVIKLFQFETPQELLLPFTLLFISAAVFSGVVRVALLSLQTRLSTAIGTDFGVKVYEYTLYQPLSTFLSRNSSEMLVGSKKASELMNTLIQPVMLLSSSAIILVAITTALLVIQPLVALSAFFGFGAVYALVAVVARTRLKKNSQIIAQQQVRVTKTIQEGFGGIRDVLIDGTQPIYVNMYKDSFVPLQFANASNQVISGAPRFAVEALGVSLIAALAYSLARSTIIGNDLINIVPVLGALALGAQRILPVLQQIYTAFTHLKGNQASNQDVLELLDQPSPTSANTQILNPISLQTAIYIKNLSYQYTKETPMVLKGLNFKIYRGSRVGFVGKTGSGKSTLLDILMGLLTPTEGAVYIDDQKLTLTNTRAWQANISHVPQSIFLSDTSIAENIAFGVRPNRIDLERVKQAAHQAQLAKSIESWKDGYSTIVGDRGIRLSGGERQRIGIARALYKEAKVIFLDEATSALDGQTEASVMQTIDSLGLNITVLMIAHRITTLRNCDRIIEIDDGSINSEGSYSQMISKID